MDLFIWFHDDVPIQFQLAYDKRGDEKAISWDSHSGYHLYRVDTGESALHRYKKTPILIYMCDQKNLAVLARDFLIASEPMDTWISDFIYARLMAYPTLRPWHNARNTDHSALR